MDRRYYLPIFLTIVIMLVAAYLIIVKPARLIPGLGPTPSPTFDSINFGDNSFEIMEALEQDDIPAIDNPQFYSVEEADKEYLEAELVIGVKINGESRAYSSGLLDEHEVVNDVLGGRKIVVTWCPLCFTGIVYSREIDGQEFDFGVSGKLIMNNLVMYDRQTGSLWAQMPGEAVEGEMKGTKLDFIPAVHTNWEDWKKLNPDTSALVKDLTGDFSRYGRYFRSGDAGVMGRTHEDNRLRLKELLIGAEHNNEAAAYPFRVLNRQPIVNDDLGGSPILVVFNPDSNAGLVFNRQLEDGRVLNFSQLEGTLITDEQSGSTWDGMEGLALEGPLAGTRLDPVKNMLAFWFAWVDWYPETRVYGIDE